MKWIFFIPIVAFGCSLLSSDQSDRLQERSMSVVEMKIISQTESSIVFQTIIELPTPCWHFKRTQISDSGDIIGIRPFYESDPQVICPQVIASDTLDVTITQLSSGAHRFQFWSQFEPMIDTTIVIP